MEQRIIYVGPDVHKDTIAVALAEAGKRGDVREHGKIANTPILATTKIVCDRIRPLAALGHILSG